MKHKNNNLQAARAAAAERKYSTKLLRLCLHYVRALKAIHPLHPALRALPDPPSGEKDAPEGDAKSGGPGVQK